MREAPHTLIVNLSLRSMRVIIFNELGSKIYEDWLPVRTYINGSIVEQDPNEWWHLLIELLQKEKFKKEFAGSIGFISATSSALCLVVLDKSGNILDKSLMVSDKRASLESKDIQEKFSDFFKVNFSFKPEPSFMLPKILWLKRNKQKVFKNAKKYLSSNDFLIYKLTGKILTDTLNAEKFYYNTEKHQYPEEMLNFLNLTTSNLPVVVSPGTLVGELRPQLKKQLHLTQSVKIIISTYDAICALIGSSTYQEGELNNVCGTCSSYRIFSSSSSSAGNSNLVVQNFSEEKTYIIGGSNNLEGGLLEWAKDCFYGDSFSKDNEFLYNLIQSEARQSELGANGLIFMPYLLGERMPFLDPDVRGAFFGVERYHMRKDIIRSIFEAMSFQARLMLEEFEKNGFPISFVNMSGGLAKIPLAAQLRSDVLGLPVNVLQEIETTALGAFILCLKAREKISTVKESKDLVKIQTQYLPNMHNHNCYSSLFGLYKRMYNQTKDIFSQRKSTMDDIIHYRRKVLENL